MSNCVDTGHVQIGQRKVSALSRDCKSDSNLLPRNTPVRYFYCYSVFSHSSLRSNVLVIAMGMAYSPLKVMQSL